MPTTRNDLAKSPAKTINPILQQHLVDALDLHSQLKQAHWNIVGPQFIAIHELFDKVAEDVDGYADDLAERIRQLGGLPRGTVRVAAKQSSLEEYPLGEIDWRKHIAAVSEALAAFGKSVRKAIETVDKKGDKGSADLFTEISRGIDKWLWFVESHLG